MKTAPNVLMLFDRQTILYRFKAIQFHKYVDGIAFQNFSMLYEYLKMS